MVRWAAIDIRSACPSWNSYHFDSCKTMLKFVNYWNTTIFNMTTAFVACFHHLCLEPIYQNQLKQVIKSHIVICMTKISNSNTCTCNAWFHQCYSWGCVMGHRPIQQKNVPLTTEIAILNLKRIAHWNFKFIGNKWKRAHTRVCPAITLVPWWLLLFKIRISRWI